MTRQPASEKTLAFSYPGFSQRFRKTMLGRLLRRSNGAIGLAIVFTMVAMAILSPILSPLDPNAQNLMARLKPPVFSGGTWTHVLGTDQLGRDILSRVMHGAQISLFIGFVTAAIAGIIGTTVGLVAGFSEGVLRTALMRLVDIFLAIPYILFAVVVVGALGAGITNLILVLALTRWVQFARIVYGQTLSVREKEYVEAARVRGNSYLRILIAHVLPNVATPIVVVMTLEVAFMIIMESALTFLGLGVAPDTATWGWMLAEGKDYMTLAWWLTVVPGLAIMLTVLGINLLGDALRDTLDPRLKL
ncbi:ABC transporter permease [Castellaniella sp. S9]|uniref:ABC transporter permease n=1 Tax=Castellaniella sp. S9 TaxID=2993652 RepID=UPI0022B4B0EF|nr:ABC transporter permease [Castellaniella sp. S9]